MPATIGLILYENQMQACVYMRGGRRELLVGEGERIGKGTCLGWLIQDMGICNRMQAIYIIKRF